MAVWISRSHVMVILSISLVMMVAVRLYFDREDVVKLVKNQQNSLNKDVPSSDSSVRAYQYSDFEVEKDEKVVSLMGKLIEQRNKLSRALNLKQQKVGQLECGVGVKCFHYGLLSSFRFRHKPARLDITPRIGLNLVIINTYCVGGLIND